MKEEVKDRQNFAGPPPVVYPTQLLATPAFVYCAAALIVIVAALAILALQVSDKIQPALISGIFTLVTAAGGVVIVVFQLSRQARNAYNAIVGSELLKLKKDIYLEVLPEIKEAENARLQLTSFINGFSTDVYAAPVYRANGHEAFLPSARIDAYMKRRVECGEKLIAIVSIVDRWQIIDLRLAVFRTVIQALQMDMNAVDGAYANIAIAWVPHNDDPKQWSPPEGEVLKKFQEISDDYFGVLVGVAAIISDFKCVMQNLLLDEMFEAKVPPRKAPEGARYPTVELSKHKELEAYYSEKGRWGNQAMSFYRRQMSTP